MSTAIITDYKIELRPRLVHRLLVRSLSLAEKCGIRLDCLTSWCSRRYMDDSIVVIDGTRLCTYSQWRFFVKNEATLNELTDAIERLDFTDQ